jgi:hypothetical protein
MDGQTEWLNQYLEGFLTCSVQACPKQWHKWLPVAEYWYNTCFHSALGLSPFEVLYGHTPRHFGILNDAQFYAPIIEQWLLERKLLQDVVKHQLTRI